MTVQQRIKADPALLKKDNERRKRLRDSFYSFVQQRRWVYKNVHPDPLLLRNCENLLKSWEAIRQMNYWRHCYEIKKHAALIRTILPSPRAGHAAINTRWENIIRTCRAIAAVPAHIYYQKRTNQTS